MYTEVYSIFHSGKPSVCPVLESYDSGTGHTLGYPGTGHTLGYPEWKILYTSVYMDTEHCIDAIWWQYDNYIIINIGMKHRHKCISKCFYAFAKCFLANIAQCNIIFSDLENLLKCYWPDSRPTVNLKPKWLNPIHSINLHNWTISFCRRS